MVIRDDSVKIAKISRFRMDHADYAGLNDREKRRRITLLLKKANLLVTSELLSSEANEEAYNGIEGAQEYQSTRTKMHAEGILWVKCNTNSGQPVREGYPVIFDPVTGSQVTGYPSTPMTTPAENDWSNYAYSDHTTWNNDEFVVVGYAMSDPVSTPGGNQVPIRLARQHDFPEGRMIIIGTPGSQARSSPRVHQDQSYYVDPAPGKYVASNHEAYSWAELRIATIDRQFSSGNEGLINSLVCEGGVVFNPYPFGFKGTSGDSAGGGCFVHRNGAGSFIIDRPISAMNYPCAMMTFSGHVSDDGFNLTINPTLSSSSYGILAPGSTNKWKWLPTYQWRYRISGMIRIIPSSGQTIQQTVPWIRLTNLFETMDTAGIGTGNERKTAIRDTVDSATFTAFTREGGHYNTHFSRIVDVTHSTSEQEFLLQNVAFNSPAGTRPAVSGEIFIEPIF